jgi:hypothetical protein
MDAVLIPRFEPFQQAHRTTVRNAPGDAGLVNGLGCGHAES